MNDTDIIILTLTERLKKAEAALSMLKAELAELRERVQNLEDAEITYRWRSN